MGRCLNGTEKIYVRKVSQSGVSNPQILTFLKKNTGNIHSTLSSDCICGFNNRIPCHHIGKKRAEMRVLMFHS
jgi:hypothetical protein